MKPRRSQKSAVISLRWLFKLLLSTGRDDKVSYLRGQETSKPTHSLDLADLIRTRCSRCWFNLNFSHFFRFARVVRSAAAHSRSR